MFQKKLFSLLFVSLWVTTGSLFCSQEDPETKWLNLITYHLGNDEEISQKSNGQFPTATSIVTYISNLQDATLPPDTSWLHAMDLIGTAKATELKRVFGCPGEPSELDSDEISTHKKAIEILVRFGITIYSYRKIKVLADLNRRLATLENVLAEEINAATQENRDELRSQRTEAQEVQTAVQNLAEEVKAITRNSDGLQDNLEHDPLGQKRAFE